MIKTFIFLLTISLFSCSSVKESNTYTKNGVAVDGYDLVSYFEGFPKKGNEQHSVVYEMNTYYFANQQHAQQFKSRPEQYLPQYGGYCAYAMAIDGSKISINPKSYEIRDGKLYLFYSNVFNNTLKNWSEKEPEKLIQDADKNWVKTRSTKK